MPLTLLLAASIGIFAIHTVEIWTYAALYLALGNFGHFEESLYYSTVTYASIGYGDVLMPQPWRILGAIEEIGYDTFATRARLGFGARAAVAWNVWRTPVRQTDERTPALRPPTDVPNITWA